MYGKSTFWGRGVRCISRWKCTLIPVFPLPAGIYVIRPPGPHPSRKVRVLTELLIECFDQASPAGCDGRFVFCMKWFAAQALRNVFP